MTGVASEAHTTAVNDSPVQIPPAGAHGGDGAQVALALGLRPDEVLDLSASLNPFAPDVVALAHGHLTSLGRYPDVERAERVTAEMVGVDAERLVLTAGGSQAIALVAQHLGEGWVEEPDFSLYRRHLARLSPAAPGWRSDPHSPSGVLADTPVGPTGSVGGQSKLPAAGVTVWDEAFLPLSAGVWTRGRPGWALGSLTKAFACPGLRMGFVLAPHAGAASDLRGRRPEWAVSSLACALLPHLAELADPTGWSRQIAAARRSLTELLAGHGLETLPSDAPWVLVRHPSPAQSLRDVLARQGIVVRDCASFGLPDHFRIAVPDEPGLARLAQALEQAAAPT